MNIISVIGTRPQYIKLKPVDAFCKENGIKHMSLDTNQHYSDSVSKDIKRDLGLDIDINLRDGAFARDEIEFISQVCSSFKNVLETESLRSDVFCLIYGDTNSSFAAALVCYKLNIPFAHVEAGARCFNNRVPEEVNRIFVDSSATINFCTSKNSLENIKGGILTGDLEYELLKSMQLEGGSGNYSVMTIHRQSNMDAESLSNIFQFCKKLGKVVLPIHHRLRHNKVFANIDVPKNIEIIDPLPFSEMAKLLSSCKNILSDSGGLLKTAPFFGKRLLSLRSHVGWTEVLEADYARIATFSDDDISWLNGPVMPADKNFYTYGLRASQVIIEGVLNEC